MALLKLYFGWIEVHLIYKNDQFSSQHGHTFPHNTDSNPQLRSTMSTGCTSQVEILTSTAGSVRPSALTQVYLWGVIGFIPLENSWKISSVPIGDEINFSVFFFTHSSLEEP